MAGVNELYNELRVLQYEIGKIVKRAKNGEYDYEDGIECDEGDPDELMRKDFVSSIIGELEKAMWSMEYLEKEVMIEGVLEKNSDGRYTVGNITYTSGDSIEALIYDRYYDRHKWVVSRVEHDGEDYYIVGEKGIPMESLIVRYRG